MDFIKSAVAAVGSVKGPPFPYTFGDQVTLDQSIWKLFNGVKRVGETCICVRRLDLLIETRRTSLTAVSSRLMSPRTSLDYPLPRMRFESYER